MNLFANISQFTAHILIVSGAFILCYSLYPATRIVTELPLGIIRRRWVVLRLFIILFILGYLIYAVFAIQKGTLYDLIVGVIYLLGAIFVMFVCQLTLNTVKDLKQLDVLQAENITDDLTGLHNRRHLARALENEISQAKNYNIPLSILMLDLDYYKKINDLHGHEAGDRILKCVAKIIKQATRRMDIVARYGGDEISVVLPNTDKATASSIAERIRFQVEERSKLFHHDVCKSINIDCTVSIGVATITDDTTDARHLLLMADEALYQAKQSGRNRVVMHDIKMTEIRTKA